MKIILGSFLGMVFYASIHPLQAAPGDNLLGRWGPQFSWPIVPIHATLLPNGKVFTFGTNGQGVQGAQFNYSVWDPISRSHQMLPNSTSTDIFCSAAGLLPNGDVLVAGGDTRNPPNIGIRDSLVFQTGPQSLIRTDYMNFARWYPTVITLPSGELMIQGGREADGQPIATPEIFSNGHWRSLWGATSTAITENAEAKWFYPRNFVAPNGRIFGISGNIMYFIDWGGDGATQTAGFIPDKTRSHTSTAVMYRPGKIFQAGGSTHGDTQAQGSNQAIAVDVSSGWPQVTSLPSMAFRRVWANSTVLPSGEVLITGGSGFENQLIDPAKTAEMWNPDTRSFRNLATAATPRLYHSVALLLPDASVLVGGGGSPGPLTNLNAEIYYPPYLFDGAGNFAARLNIGGFNSNQFYNNTVSIPYSGSGTVRKVALIRTGSVTHSFDMSQRYLDLAFAAQGNSVQVRMPDSPNLAPPGFYMLFLINEQGVPSVARILSLAQGGGSSPQVGQAYSLVARFSGKCADVDNGDSANAANILQWSCHGGNNQKFRVQAAANGAFNLVNVQTGKCVDVSGPSTADGATIHQWECHGGSNQAVRFIRATAGSYEIRFDHSGKCMDVSGPDATDGVDIHQWTCLGGLSNQEWYFKQ